MQDCRAGIIKHSKKSKDHKKSKHNKKPKTLGIVAQNVGEFISEIGEQLSQVDIKSSSEESDEVVEKDHSHHHHHHHHHKHHHKNSESHEGSATHRHDKKRKHRHHKNHVHHTHHKKEHGKRHVHHTHHKRDEKDIEYESSCSEKDFRESDHPGHTHLSHTMLIQNLGGDSEDGAVLPSSESYESDASGKLIRIL